MSRLTGKERREQLLDVAEKLFARHGYARATTAELAKAAGVTEPIIYRHFDSKRALFIALIQRTAQRTLGYWEQQLASAADPAQRLRRLIGENPMVSEQAREAYRVFLQAITEVEDDEIRKAVHDHIGNLHAFLVREIVRAQSEHKVAARFTPELIAWLLIDVGLGYGLLSALRIPGHGMDARGAHVQEAIARMLVGRGGDEA
ncbi:MAG: TetR/AcrR family transcriptional regulator [Planctomycetota bacterium]|nr:TetR/AcrR family transcriptional regulator [Planctomycetota bacterium]